jgi:hypothetical protein
LTILVNECYKHDVIQEKQELGRRRAKISCAVPLGGKEKTKYKSLRQDFGILEARFPSKKYMTFRSIFENIA